MANKQSEAKSASKVEGTADVRVTSEVGRLRKLLVHSPDSGLGKVVPSKAQDWLFEDIVHLDTIRRKEYDYYTKILLYFLDPERIQGRLSEIDDAGRGFYKPGRPGFFKSDKVIELQWLLAEILENREIRMQLIASVCAIESCSFQTQGRLVGLTPSQLATVFITGSIDEKEMLFPPIPNFIFTRDIGIVIGEYLLLNKPAKKARTREALLSKYIFFYHPFFERLRPNVLELSETFQHFLLPKDGDEKKVTLEGGDIMVVTPDHVLVGVSERTSLEAAYQVTNLLFARGIVSKVSIVRIPKKRDYMHIDTIFTQIKRNVWVMLGNFSKKAITNEDSDPVQRILEGRRKEDQLHITQFRRDDVENPVYFSNLEDFLVDVSLSDLRSSEETVFIYSGNNEFPFDVREQWTDSCNLLALKEGVVLGYDRNDKTVEAFRRAGFQTLTAEEVINGLELGTLHVEEMMDTLILMPSSELSRARGGFHCMSLPLLRDDLD